MLDFLKELTRRKVWLFGGIYLALGWIVLQVAIAIESTMKLPDWIDQSVLVLLALGFPFALLMAWAQETQVERIASPNEAGGVAAAGTSKERPSFSVAVLPFDDLSQDGSFAGIADGVPEDVITQLSWYSALRVSARNSSFAFKGTSPDIRKVGEELHVRFVLEGSSRKMGKRVRITAQLIDAVTGEHAWSDNFDRPAERLEDELDKVVDAIVGEVFGAISELEQKRLMARPPGDLSARDLGSLARQHLADITLPRLREAETLMKAALEKAPDDGKTHALIAQVHTSLARFVPDNRSEHIRFATEHLEKAKSIGTRDLDTLRSMALVAMFMGRLSELDVYVEQMRALSPKNPETWGMLGAAHMKRGNFEGLLKACKRGKELRSISSPWTMGFVTMETSAHLGLGNFKEAEASARNFLSVRDSDGGRLDLIAALAHQGKLDEARSELEILKSSVGKTMTLATEGQDLRDSNTQNNLIAVLLEGLRLAGLEEGGEAADA